MSNILISPPPTTLLTGLLQLSGGVAMSSTPVYVTDQNNTASVLALSTSNVKIGTTTASSYLLDVNGNARVRTNFEITSGTTADMYLNYQNSGNIYYQYSGVTYWQQSVDNNDNFRIYTGTKGLHIQRANGYATFNNGSTTLNSTVGIKGSGSTSATTSMLVQNSSSTQLFKVTDDGKVTIGNGTTGTALLDVAIGGGSGAGVRIKGYSDASTPYLISLGTESYQQMVFFKMVNGNTTIQNQFDGFDIALKAFNGGIMVKNSGSVGIGTDTPNVSAKLDVNSTTQGFLPPVMTTAQKTAIGSPSKGLIVFDSSLNKLCVYSGTAWETITSV